MSKVDPSDFSKRTKYSKQLAEAHRKDYYFNLNRKVSPLCNFISPQDIVIAQLFNNAYTQKRDIFGLFKEQMKDDVGMNAPEGQGRVAFRAST